MGLLCDKHKGHETVDVKNVKKCGVLMIKKRTCEFMIAEMLISVVKYDESAMNPFQLK